MLPERTTKELLDYYWELLKIGNRNIEALGILNQVFERKEAEHDNERAA